MRRHSGARAELANPESISSVRFVWIPGLAFGEPGMTKDNYFPGITGSNR